jgi:hypothetical protein
LGICAPPTPVTARSYAQQGFPFFAIYEEPKSSISGDFSLVQSVAAIDELRGDKTKAREMAEPIAFPVILLDSEDRITFRPVSELIHETQKANVVHF